ARVLVGELLVELGEALHVVLDELDLAGARAAEVAVVGEHAPGERRVLLVEEQLERLLPADQVGGAHLPGERGAVVAELARARLLLGGERGAARRALGALAAHVDPGLARPSHRQLRAPQLARQAVALDLLAAHLAADALDLGLDRLRLFLGLPGVGLGAVRGRPGPGAGTEPAAGEHGGPRPRAAPGARGAERQGGAIMRALLRPRHDRLPYGSRARIRQ